jgi:ribosomal protein S18 acetylase RimI-like enzyme
VEESKRVDHTGDRGRKTMAEKSVRPAKPGDAAAVGELVRASYSKYVGRIGKEPAPMLEDYAALIRAGEVWVLVEGGEVLGVLVMRPAEDHLFVDNVAVAPGHQGRGLGRELMAFVEERAKRDGLPEVRLYTNEKMHENLAVYGKLGFGETERKLDGGYRRVFMRKRLS